MNKLNDWLVFYIRHNAIIILYVYKIIIASGDFSLGISVSHRTKIVKKSMSNAIALKVHSIPCLAIANFVLFRDLLLVLFFL